MAEPEDKLRIRSRKLFDRSKFPGSAWNAPNPLPHSQNPAVISALTEARLIEMRINGVCPVCEKGLPDCTCHERGTE